MPQETKHLTRVPESGLSGISQDMERRKALSAGTKLVAEGMTEWIRFQIKRKLEPQGTLQY